MADLSNLPPGSVAAFAKTTRWMRDRVAYVTEACKTYDETDPVNPIKPFPNKRHIEAMVRCWEEYYLYCIIKSRRMQATWTMCALDLHLPMITRHAPVFIISDDQSKSDKLVARCLFIYNNLPPEFMKPRIKVHIGQKGDPTRIDFIETDSRIEALPEDPDKIRQEGAALLHIEEFQSWQWPEESYKSMLPTVQGGGRLAVIGTARAATLFQKLVFDSMGQAVGTA